MLHRKTGVTQPGNTHNDPSVSDFAFIIPHKPLCGKEKAAKRLQSAAA